MLVMTGVFENERFIPDKPVAIPQNTKVVVTIEEASSHRTEAPERDVPKMYVPQNSEGKFILSKEVLEEMEKNSPSTQRLSGILSSLGDVDLDKVRMERLAKHL